MTHLLVTLAIRAVVFGLALWLAVRWFKDVRVTPKKMLPLVAIVFALLNVALSWILITALSVVTLGLFGILVPFVVNAVLLWGTDKVLRPLKIDGLFALLKTAALITACHVALRLAGV